MAPPIAFNDSVDIEKQLKTRSQIDKHLNKIEAMLHIASVASAHEPIDVDIAQDYLSAIQQLVFEAKKANEAELDALLEGYIPLEEDDRIKNTVRFTSREIECLQQLMEGKSPSEIAEDLEISARTVDFYAINAIKKLASLTTLKPKP